MTKQQILKQLQDILQRSHSPYSGVQVAAAVVYRKDNQQQVEFGVNVENASYGLTNCAERTAIFAAVTKGMTDIDAVYIIGNMEQPISPCGACRQVITEFMSDSQAPVVCFNQAGDKEWQTTLGDLLPNRFTL